MGSQSAAGLRVLVTGAEGYLGRQLMVALSRCDDVALLVGVDVRPPETALDGVVHEIADIRSERVGALIQQHRITTVVHLAAIVKPPRSMTREEQFSIDVGGTETLVKACIEHGVSHFVTTSSAAAYGYHADNPSLLTESCPLRGNQAFAYAHHKRLVEAYLAEVRREHPQLCQLVFRPGTILGEIVQNQITALFEQPVVFGIKGATTPFNFIWDQDVVRAIVDGIVGGKGGIFNLCADGVVTLREIAAEMGKPYFELPPALLSQALTVLNQRGVLDYGPEQMMFLQYRPVPCNERLKRVFGYQPQLSSLEVFRRYRHAAQQRESRVGQLAQRLSTLKLRAPRWTPQRVVITGGAGGIGRALASEFGARGAAVALIDVDQAGLDRAVGALRQQRIQAVGYRCDVTDYGECERVFQRIAESWGDIDVLINNAGISHRSLLSETRPEVIERVMRVNFFGASHCTQVALQALLRSKGMIVTISSVAGFAPLIGRTGYAASKHALHGFFESLRSELVGTGVGVLLVCPSFVETPLEQTALSGKGGPVGATHPRAVIGKKITPQQLAQQIVTATLRRKKRLPVTVVAKSAWWLSRLLPDAYQYLMRRGQRSEFG